MRLTISTLAVAAMTLGACATAGAPRAQAQASLAPIAGSPLPTSGQLFAACIRQATEANTVDREGPRLRFRCSGAPAQALYDGLNAWTHSGGEGSEMTGGGRTYRITTTLRQDLSGADHCSVDASGGDARCDLNLTVGPFLTTP